MIKNSTVLLKDNTVGVVKGTDKADIGDMVTVSLHNENGMPIEVEGVVIEVLIDAIEE